MNALAKHLQIQTALDAKRPARAVELAEVALTEDPDDAMLHTLLAVALRELGDDGRAKEAADRALALEQADPWIWHVAALTRLSRKQDRKEAMQLLETALRIDPNFVASHVTVASLLARPAFNAQGRINLSQADRHANVAMKLAPESPDGYHAMSLVCRARGDNAGAHFFATEAVRRDPADVHSRTALAEAAAASGNLRAAGDHFVAAGKLEPSGQSLRGLRGLRVNLPVGVFGLFVLFRLGAGIGRSLGYSGDAVLMATVVALAVLGVGYVVVRRLLTRRQLSTEARQVLRTDRRNRRSRWRIGLRR